MKKVDALQVKIQNILLASAAIKGHIVELHEDLFALRLEGLQHHIINQNDDLQLMFTESIDNLSQSKVSKEFEILRENLLFALRCFRNISRRIMGDEGLEFKSSIEKLSVATYKQFCVSLRDEVKNPAQAKDVIAMLDASLQFDFVILSFTLLTEGVIKVSQDVIDELAFIAADSAQEFSAIVSELSINKDYSYQQILENSAADLSFIHEQQSIANLGLDDFEKNFTEE